MILLSCTELKGSGVTSVTAMEALWGSARNYTVGVDCVNSCSDFLDLLISSKCECEKVSVIPLYEEVVFDRYILNELI